MLCVIDPGQCRGVAGYKERAAEALDAWNWREEGLVGDSAAVGAVFWDGNTGGVLLPWRGAPLSGKGGALELKPLQRGLAPVTTTGWGSVQGGPKTPAAAAAAAAPSLGKHEDLNVSAEPVGKGDESPRL